MDFIVCASTDIGNVKSTNQDSLTLKVFRSSLGKLAFCVVCDGMGGLEKGEVASSVVISAFNEWSQTELPTLCTAATLDLSLVEVQWSRILSTMNEQVAAYGAAHGVQLGTTVIAMLLTQDNYLVMNIGDSRAYEIQESLDLLTKDHTLVAREVEMGLLTPEQAHNDPRRSVLLQCVGASPTVRPDFFTGTVKKDAVYVLCTDGFRHEVSEEELFAYLHPSAILSAEHAKQALDYLIELNKYRNERDNISVALIRTY